MVGVEGNEDPPSSKSSQEVDRSGETATTCRTPPVPRTDVNAGPGFGG